jgi:hypothetical protein
MMIDPRQSIGLRQLLASLDIYTSLEHHIFWTNEPSNREILQLNKRIDKVQHVYVFYPVTHLEYILYGIC